VREERDADFIPQTCHCFRIGQRVHPAQITHEVAGSSHQAPRIPVTWTALFYADLAPPWSTRLADPPFGVVEAAGWSCCCPRFRKGGSVLAEVKAAALRMAGQP
jgi:hypothetical protein